MKHILFPTDFSNVSNNAFRYARALAELWDAELTVLHVYYPNVSGISNTGDYVVLMDQGESTAKKRLDFFVEEGLAEEGSVVPKMKKETAIGFPAEEVALAAKRLQADLIVMGTRKKHGLTDKFFGSVTTATLASAECPVWVIPAEAEFRGIHNILYASNQHKAELSGLNQCMNLAKTNKATLHYVHVNEDIKQGYRIQDRIYEKVMEDQENSVSFIMTTINSSSVEKGLESYVEENDVDLVVLLSAPKTMIERLFYQSNARKMVFRTKVPMLVIRE